jgi:hypothetical protein
MWQGSTWTDTRKLPKPPDIRPPPTFQLFPSQSVLSNRCHPPFQSVPPTDWEGRVGGVASIRETAGDGSAVYAPVESDSASFWGRCPRQELPNTAVPLAHRAEARMRLCRSPQSSAATRT